MGSRLDRNAEAVRKRIANHTFDDEHGEEYNASRFGDFSDYFRRKKIKLQNLDAHLRSESADKPQLFKGVVAHVNGYTQPSLNDLHMLIVQHGGGFMQYLDGKTTVTHIIASNLTPKKAVEFRKYRIVKPAWVVDSIKAAKLLPWQSYRVLDEGESQKVLAFDNGNVTSRATEKTHGYRDQSDNSWYTSQLQHSQSKPPVPSPTPHASVRPRLSRKKLPTPDDDIEEEQPHSHQPEHVPLNRSWVEQLEDAARALEKPAPSLETPPRTSPTPEDRQHTGRVIAVDNGSGDDDETYVDRTNNVNASKTVSHVAVQEAIAKAQLLKGKPLTAEEHNAILLRDPKVRKSTVVDPNFLKQYYQESRLHHLSTWKAELKAQLQALASEKSSSQKTKQKRPPGTRRYILHVDFDSFFAAVSSKKYPQYMGKPAVVAHGSGDGSEIASCNYPARKFGVKNGMWMKRAKELCPDLKVLPYDFPAYEETSKAFYNAILATGGLVQSVSIDEALIDVSNLCIDIVRSDGGGLSEDSIYREQAKAEKLAQSLRDEVKAMTGCNVSVGIGGNILLAKVALRKAKPAGQYLIKPEEVLDFIGQLQVQDLPGVAWSIGGKLEEIGVKIVRDIREVTKERLIRTLGPKTGEKLWEYSRGIDRQEVGEQVFRRSISAEVNWGVRFENQEQAKEFIGSLCGELQKRLLKERVKGRQFTMRIMKRSPDAPMDPPKNLGHGKCDTYNKSLVLGVATNSKEILTKEALSILKGFGISPGELRGIGVQMTKLEPMKNATDGSLESSQRRLQFKPELSVPKQVRNAPEVVEEADPIQDDPVTPRKPKTSADEEEHLTFGPSELNHSTPSRRPLNVMGTQFIMPTQVDPKVLAELPEDIRSKLLKQVRHSLTTPKTPDVLKQTPKASPSKATPFAFTALPAHSQLDPEILAALPPDVRAEVLAQYAAATSSQSPSRRPRHIDQTILPQSPRKNRIIGIPAKRPIVPPKKRGRGRPPRSAQLAAAALANARDSTGKILTQANFISLKNPARLPRDNSVFSTASDETDSEGDVEELDTEFLAALPGDVRKEILEEHKRKRLQATRHTVQSELSGHPGQLVQPMEPVQPIESIQPMERVQSVDSVEPAQPAEPVQSVGPVEAVQNLDPPPTITVPRPPRPTFTKDKLHDKNDLRIAVKEWIREFPEGPYEVDIEALVTYLGMVVRDEKDIGKAVAVVKWFEWMIDDFANGDMLFSGEKWKGTLVRVKDGVQIAVAGRGIGPVTFV